MPTSYGVQRGKRTALPYKVKERDQIKSVLALTVNTAMSYVQITVCVAKQAISHEEEFFLVKAHRAALGFIPVQHIFKFVVT
jgi:hypothetical protein